MSLLLVSAAESRITLNGETVHGLQSIDFKVRRRQADIESVGWGERIGVESGQVVVTGTLRISSLNPMLDDLLYEEVPESFSLVCELRKGLEMVRRITFDDCFLDDKSFEMGANGVGLTVYNFTATRVREE